MADPEKVDVVLANSDRVTLRVGDTFIKVDADSARSEVEVDATRRAPVPTPEILWHEPPALALRALRGRSFGDGPVSSGAWASAGEHLRRLHDAPLPPWPGPSLEQRRERLMSESSWLVESAVLRDDVVETNVRLAQAALCDWNPVFVHGDLHREHVFADGDEVTGIIDWSEASQGDALFDLALLTLADPECLEDVLAGYGRDVDRERIWAWQSWRCLTSIRWLIENGYGDSRTFPETEVLLRHHRR